MSVSSPQKAQHRHGEINSRSALHQTLSLIRINITLPNRGGQTMGCFSCAGVIIGQRTSIAFAQVTLSMSRPCPSSFFLFCFPISQSAWETVAVGGHHYPPDLFNSITLSDSFTTSIVLTCNEPVVISQTMSGY